MTRHDEAKWDASSARASSPPSQVESDTQARLDRLLPESTKDLLASVLTSSLDGIMAFRSVRDEAGKIVDFEWLLANPASEALTGRKTHELIGKRLLEEMPGNREEGLFRPLRARRRDGRALVLSVHRRRAARRHRA
jgi:PAS domain-containing protein